MTEKGDDRCGVWATADGRFRVELRADGRFVEHRSDRAQSHGGTYRWDGCRIQFHDPVTGYRAIGEYRDGMLYAEGCEFRRS